jgi:hypothetical protein
MTRFRSLARKLRIGYSFSGHLGQCGHKPVGICAGSLARGTVVEPENPLIHMAVKREWFNRNVRSANLPL